MYIKPVGERVLIKPTKPLEKTKGGIYLPDSAKDKKEGEVVAVGTMKDGKLMPLQKGDRILYGGYSNEEFAFEGEDYIIVEFKDVLAKVER